MELMFESRRDVFESSNGKLRAVQGKPEMLPEPVLEGDSDVDATGVSIYGTVLRDGGLYRMWYQAWPRDWDGQDVAHVGYAESDDGLAWRKPKLRMAEAGGSRENNLCDLGMHSPSVFVDPTAPAAKRYRATGCVGPRSVGGIAGVKTHGYHAACSADGLHWVLDGDTPRWPESDVITSIWHDGRGEPLVAFKRNPRIGGFQRRTIWTDTLRDGGEPSRGTAALLPDEYDDVAATTRGCNGADYYGMGMQPAGAGTVGFVWHFRHQLPRTQGNQCGVFGFVDVGLAFQEKPGDAWRHVYGRPDFLSHDAQPWTQGGLYTANRPTECGAEHRLYFTGTLRTHGWYVSEQWEVLEDRKRQLIEAGMSRIGVARWPAWRLFGMRADPEGMLSIHLGKRDTPFRLRLNYTTERTGGSVRVEQRGTAGRELADAVPLEGEGLSSVVAWRGGDRLAPGPSASVRVHLDRATLWGWQLEPG